MIGKKNDNREERKRRKKGTNRRKGKKGSGKQWEKRCEIRGKGRKIKTLRHPSFCPFLTLFQDIKMKRKYGKRKKKNNAREEKGKE